MKKGVFLVFIALLCCENKSTDTIPKNYTKNHREALEFCKKNNFETSFYFLVDLSIHSGKNRFLVYDFQTKKVSAKNLVTHGSCDQFQENPKQWEKAKFDVRIDSHCSMKGKYKIGKKDYSSWGIHIKYWLHGLEKTNNTAVDRVVVLHSWSAVANEEIYPKHTPLSWGCPAVSDAFMEELDLKLKTTKKPVLLWIID